MLARLGWKGIFVSGLNCTNNFVDDVQNLIRHHREKLGKISFSDFTRPFGMPEHEEQFNSPLAHLHVRRRTLENDRRDLCATFYLALEMGESDGEVGRIAPKNEVNLPTENSCEGQLEQLVLVNVCELSEQGESSREFSVWSIVRLHRLDCCPYINTQCLNSSLSAGAIETAAGITDWKLQSVSVGRRVLPSSLMNGDGVNQMIEGASQVVDAIGKQQTPSLEGRLGRESQNDFVLGKLSIWLMGNTVRIFVKPGGELILDGLGVFPRMPNLSPHAV